MRSHVVTPVAPVPDAVDRPFWSVMIPTYNSTDLLEQTLRCVLDQDQSRDRMQIAIVDDRSPNGRSRAIVETLAPGRIEFFEQPSNVGLAENWNTCIEKSRGRWVHILHQDDLLLPGFYERMGAADEAGIGIGAAFCRFDYIDGQGVRTKLGALERDTPGVLEDWADRIAVEQRIQCPSIVVRREVYERLGGFRRDLRFALDWEMWARIAFHHPVWYEPQVLARWRDHSGSESQRLKDAGVVLDDIERGIEAICGHAPPSKRAAIRRDASRLSSWWFHVEIERLMGAGKPGQALRLAGRCCRHESPSRRVEVMLKYARWALKTWLKSPASLPGRGEPVAEHPAGARGDDRG